MLEEYGLVCAGGGAVGAYQVGLLKFIHENYCINGRSPFKIFSGISCGSLNTSFLSCHSDTAFESMAKLEELWIRFHVPEYSQSLTRALLSLTVSKMLKKRKGRPWSLLDPTPMEKIIEEGFLSSRLDQAFKSGSTLGTSVSATELYSGIPVWFNDGPRAKEWKRFHSIGLRQALTCNHVAASCTIPFFLPPRKINDHYFIDGNVNLSRPFSAAVSMGATKILCIRTDLPPVYELPVHKKSFQPDFASLVRVVYKSLSKDHCSGEAEQIGVANRLAREAGFHDPSADDEEHTEHNSIFNSTFNLRKYKPIDIMIAAPSVCPDEVCDRAAERLKIDQKGVSHGFFFHREYISALINFGYEDGKSDKEKYDRFFNT